MTQAETTKDRDRWKDKRRPRETGREKSWKGKGEITQKGDGETE